MVFDGRNLLRPIILLGLAAYFAWLVLGGTLKNYINTEFSWLAVIAAGLFLLLGTASLTQIRPEPSAQHDHDHSHAHAHDQVDGHEHEHEHAHSHAGSWAALGVVSIPLLIGFLLPSKPLDALALDRDLSYSGATSSGQSVNITVAEGLATSTPGLVGVEPTPSLSVQAQATANALPDVGTAASTSPETPWTIYDWQQAYQSGMYRQDSFNGKSVDVTGIVVRPDGVPAGHFVLGRWVMRHCAADAFGVGMLVSAEEDGKIPEETWVRVQGTLSVRQISNEQTLVVQASEVDDKVGEPSVTYIFPRRVEPSR